MSIAWANHGPFGIYAMSWEDAIVCSAMGIVLGLIVAGVAYWRRDE